MQDHFPLQQERSANPELEWLHRLLARGNDNDIVSEVTEQQAGMATDPSSFVRDTVSSADSDSDGFGSDYEVKTVISQLDASVGQLSSYIPILAAPLVSKVQEGADERMANQMTYGSEDQHQSSPRRSKQRQASESVREAKQNGVIDSGRSVREAVPPGIIGSGTFWAEPVAPSISDFAETLETVTEKQLRANKLILIGRKIKRHFPGFGGSWGVVESYNVDKDVYRLR